MQMKPFVPMSPIHEPLIPEGADWTHQLKWDGYRLIAVVEEGRVELYSKRMLPVGFSYPGLKQALAAKRGTFMLDGEAVVLDPATGRPSFELMQQRSKPGVSASVRRAIAEDQVLYIVFDLLQLGNDDLRERPFRERDASLRELVGSWGHPFYTTELFADGQALWSWVEANGWEGVVSKRLSSPYREGKHHRDWLKRKADLRFDVTIVGIIRKSGAVSSLVMTKDGRYVGRVSSGLDERAKEALRALPAAAARERYFAVLPEGLRGADIIWLDRPFAAKVAASEMTGQGVLRQPRLLSLGAGG